MTYDDAWLARNDAYLGAAVAFVRARLTALLPPPPPPPDPPVAPIAENRRGLFDRMRGEPEPQILLPAPTAMTARPDDRAQLDALSGGDPPPALVALAARLGLTPFEHDVLLLCVAFELDTGIGAACAEVQGDPARRYPTLALAFKLFDAPAWEALSPGGALRRWRLIEVEQAAGRALIGRRIHADERLVNYCKGLDGLDERLGAIVTRIEEPDPLPPSQAAVATRIEDHVAGAADATITLHGHDPDSKRAVAGAVAAAQGLALYRLPAELLPAAEVEMLAGLWHRETLLGAVALYLDADASAPVARFVGRSGGLLFVDSAETLGDGATLTIDIARPTPAEQADEWRTRLGPESDDLARPLATQFDMSQADIATVARAARGGDADRRADRLWQAAREQARPAMARLAEKIDAKAGFDDIVLPPPELAQLHQIVAQVRARAQVYDDWAFRARMNRGLGISVLFAGESGTGKTMAAEVLANALRLDLYRIDLSAVVSKYIGETEKNLRRVFDAADAGGAVLFFDEADALFGKRSEVKDSHDRYANIEIDYLLQRIEAFAGLAILATNMKSALDTAFARRLRFIVNFPHPGVPERRALWSRAFPPAVPVDALDLDRLAKLNLSGGNIHAVALNAAFMAAARGGPVTTALLLEAARAEFRKLDRPVNEADFRAIAVVSG